MISRLTESGGPGARGSLAGTVIGPTFVTAILGAIRLAKSPLPRPGSPAEPIRDYYRGSATAARFSVAGQAMSIAALAEFTSAVSALARRSGTGGAVLAAVASASGAASVATLAASAATHASLTVPRDRDDERVRRLARRVFVLGGPVHGVAFGVFTGVLGLAAYRTGVLGRVGYSSALGSAAAGVAAPLYFRWENAGWLIPIGRFSGYVVCGVAGARLAGDTSTTPI